MAEPRGPRPPGPRWPLLLVGGAFVVGVVLAQVRFADLLRQRPAAARADAARDGSRLLAPDDWELARAQLDARCTLDGLLERLRRPAGARPARMGARALVRAGGTSEAVWIDAIAADDARVKGVVSSRPTRLPGVKPGDTIAVRWAHVVDWFALERDTLVGGFGERVLRARLPAAERARADGARGYVVSGAGAAEAARLDARCR